MQEVNRLGLRVAVITAVVLVLIFSLYWGGRALLTGREEQPQPGEPRSAFREFPEELPKSVVTHLNPLPPRVNQHLRRLYRNNALVIPPASYLRQDRKAGGSDHGVCDIADLIDVLEDGRTTATLNDLTRRATHVYIQRIRSEFCGSRSGFGQPVRIRAEKLKRDRSLIFAEAQK